MSSKRKVGSLGSKKDKPDPEGPEKSVTRTTERTEIEFPGVHRLGPTDMKRHFGNDGEPETVEKRKRSYKSPVDAEPERSGDIPPYADVHLLIGKRLWRQVQLAAARKGIEQSRYVEMALELVLKSEK